MPGMSGGGGSGASDSMSVSKNTASGGADVVDIEGALGRLATKSIVINHSGSSAKMDVEWSADGSTYTSKFEDLQPGDSLQIDGSLIDRIRVTGTASDVFTIIAW